MRYLMTHSLLSSWLYSMKDSPYSDATNEVDPMDEFMKVLRKEPLETTEAMQNGIDFENLVTDIILGSGDENHKWYEAAYKIAEIVNGGQLQCPASKVVTVNGFELVLYGRLDVLKAGTIYDIKFSKGYDRGKYFDSTQHPMYFEIVPEANNFAYLVSNGTDVWTEPYRREEAPDILTTISCFLNWLSVTGNLEVYKKYWEAK